MALAVGNLVYLNANSGLLSDPPLMGVVTTITGTPPEDIVIAWENGSNSAFSSASSAALVEIANDPNQDTVIGNRVKVPGMTDAIIVRTMFLNPDGANVHAALVRDARHLYQIVAIEVLESYASQAQGCC